MNKNRVSCPQFLIHVFYSKLIFHFKPNDNSTTNTHAPVNQSTSRQSVSQSAICQIFVGHVSGKAAAQPVRTSHCGPRKARQLPSQLEKLTRRSHRVGHFVSCVKATTTRAAKAKKQHSDSNTMASAQRCIEPYIINWRKKHKKNQKKTFTTTSILLPTLQQQQ